MIGVNPDAFTLRELVWMSEGKGRDRWAHTSHILATLVTVNDAKGKIHDPRTFNPYEQYAANDKTVVVDRDDKESVEALRSAFTGHFKTPVKRIKRGT